MEQEELDQMRYAVLSAKNVYENAELQYKNTLALLKYSMNFPQDSSIQMSNDMQDLDLQASQIALGSIEDNSLLPLLQTQIQLSACNVKNKKAGFLPSISAYFQQSYNAYRTSFDFFQDKPWYSQTNWGLQMKIPVFSSGKGTAVLKQSQIQLLQDENNFQMTKHGLKLQEAQLRTTLRFLLKKEHYKKKTFYLLKKFIKTHFQKKK